MNHGGAGVVAAGHPETARAAVQILEAGGNACDAAIAAFFAACVAEPVLASLGGGGFLLTRDPGRPARIHDFFAHAPRRRTAPEELDFHPIVADFGTSRQEFHIGLGAIATPGCPRGIARAHARDGHLPLAELVQPAIALAREGVEVNPFQAYVIEVVAPILEASPGVRGLYASPADPHRLIRAGERMRQPQLADSLEAFAREGEAWFHEGEFAHLLAGMCRQGGSIGLDDLERYPARSREALVTRYRGARLHTNPPPSAGGSLVAIALGLLEREADPGLDTLIGAMEATNLARDEALAAPDPPAALGHLVRSGELEALREALGARRRFFRGTTHISVIDGQGRVAGLSTSNGEGCGHLVPDTGIMPNNMLGEQDLNPRGFHRWRPDTRISSMMAPSLLEPAPGQEVVLGSGGSNRLRTAILQVILRLVDHGDDLAAAVRHPRIHYEAGCLHAERDLPELALADTSRGDLRLWPPHSLYFGGVHCAARRGSELEGAGDPRRGGVALLAGGGGRKP